MTSHLHDTNDCQEIRTDPKGLRHLTSSCVSELGSGSNSDIEQLGTRQLTFAPLPSSCTVIGVRERARCSKEQNNMGVSHAPHHSAILNTIIIGGIGPLGAHSWDRHPRQHNQKYTEYMPIHWIPITQVTRILLASFWIRYLARPLR